MPVTLTVLASLGLIVLISRFHKNLIYAVVPAIIFLALANGFSVVQIWDITWERISSTNNIFLMLVIVQVIWLSQQMKDTGVMNELVSTMKNSVSKKASMAMLPASIGILPMPGGALFSAPLVEDCDAKGEVESLLKTKINYWFRHIWEYWWPLYPGILLAIDICEVPMWKFILFQMPMTIFAVIMGYIFLLRKVKDEEDGVKPRFELKNLLRFLRLMSPVIIIVITFAIIKLFIHSIAEYNKYLPMAIGIVLAMTFLQLKRPVKLKTWKENIFSIRVIKLFILVEAIRVFGAFIEAELPNGTPLAAQMHTELSGWHIPLILVIMIIPFITAITTGLVVGFVGASFPIVMTLIGGPDADPVILYSSIVLAFGCGYAGMLLSPVHVCLIVTNEHFKTSLLLSLKKLFVPVSGLFICLMVYYLLLRCFL
jgi:integral membrane protein (TIGR00529 family)